MFNCSSNHIIIVCLWLLPTIHNLLEANILCLNANSYRVMLVYRVVWGWLQILWQVISKRARETLSWAWMGCNQSSCACSLSVNICFLDAAQALTENSHLTHLDLSGCEIGADGIALLSSSLRDMSGLQQLKLSENEFGSKGMEHLGKLYKMLFHASI